MRMEPLAVLLLAIALITVASGAVQMIRPSFVLRLVGGPDSPASNMFFGIIGMFMLLFGGLAYQGLRAREPLPLRWAALQKLGAACAVGLGFQRGIFGPAALLVAGFDLATAVLFFIHLRRLNHEGLP